MTTLGRQQSIAERQLRSLDAIRGLAVIWVVLHNVTALPSIEIDPLLHLLKLFLNPGWIGVQIFFALSGFLITGKLIDSRHANNYYSGFYAKRVLRIFPLYYAVLFVCLVLIPLLFGTPAALQPAVAGQWWLWVFVSNFASVDLYGFGHFWSLAVEEQFYLVWPWLLRAFDVRSAMRLCVCIAIIALYLRCGLIVFGAHHETLYYSTFCRMDALALGSAGAAIVRMPQTRLVIFEKRRQITAITLLLVTIGALTTDGYDSANIYCQSYGYTILSVASAVLVTLAAVTDITAPHPRSVLHTGWLCSFGKYSFAIYVLHALLHKLIGEPILQSMYPEAIPAYAVSLYAVAMLGISYALAFCSYHGFEKHFLRLKPFFAPQRSLPQFP